MAALSGRYKQMTVREEETAVQVLIWSYVRRLRRDDADERGASLVEYALLVALIAVVCIIAVSLIGGNASNKFSQVGSALQ